MNATLVRNIFDAAGNLVMIVKPDNDAQLNDPAFSPLGLYCVDVPSGDYHGAKDTRALYDIAQPIGAQKDKVIGDALAAKMQTFDTTQAIKAAYAAIQRPYDTTAEAKPIE